MHRLNGHVGGFGDVELDVEPKMNNRRAAFPRLHVTQLAHSRALVLFCLSMLHNIFDVLVLACGHGVALSECWEAGGCVSTKRQHLGSGRC